MEESRVRRHRRSSQLSSSNVRVHHGSKTVRNVAASPRPNPKVSASCSAYFLCRYDLNDYSIKTLKDTVDTAILETNSKGLKVRLSLPNDGLIVTNVSDSNQSWMYKKSELLYFWSDPFYLKVIVIVSRNRKTRFSASIFRLRGNESVREFVERSEEFFSELCRNELSEKVVKNKENRSEFDPSEKNFVSVDFVSELIDELKKLREEIAALKVESRSTSTSPIAIKEEEIVGFPREIEEPNEHIYENLRHFVAEEKAEAEQIVFANFLTNPLFAVDKQLLINTVANQFGVDLQSPFLEKLIFNQDLFLSQRRTFANMIWQISPEEIQALCSTNFSLSCEFETDSPEKTKSILKPNGLSRPSAKRTRISWKTNDE